MALSTRADASTADQPAHSPWREDKGHYPRVAKGGGVAPRASPTGPDRVVACDVDVVSELAVIAVVRGAALDRGGVEPHRGRPPVHLRTAQAARSLRTQLSPQRGGESPFSASGPWPRSAGRTECGSLGGGARQRGRSAAATLRAARRALRQRRRSARSKAAWSAVDSAWRSAVRVSASGANAPALNVGRKVVENTSVWSASLPLFAWTKTG